MPATPHRVQAQPQVGKGPAHKDHCQTAGMAAARSDDMPHNAVSRALSPPQASYATKHPVTAAQNQTTTKQFVWRHTCKVVVTGSRAPPYPVQTLDGFSLCASLRPDQITKKEKRFPANLSLYQLKCIVCQFSSWFVQGKTQAIFLNQRPKAIMFHETHLDRFRGAKAAGKAGKLATSSTHDMDAWHLVGPPTRIHT